VGNLDARRDFVDVRDAARAYWLAAARGTPGEAYNVCSGRASSVRTLLELLLDATEAAVEVVPDPGRMRPVDIPLLVGDPRKLERATGWRAEIPLRTTLNDLLEWWRTQP
jgi:GDP-4-dehydro-6-deoxy-D-mannose reductase